MKRGQAWGFDLMIAVSLFMFGILIFFFYALNSPNESASKIDDLTYEANSIAEDLMSEGFPSNWTRDDVLKIGILTDNKIDEGKLQEFYEMASEDYSRTRELFDSKYNYYMNLSEEMVIAGESVPGIGIISEFPSNLIKITRFTLYRGKPVTLNLYVWE